MSPPLNHLPPMPKDKSVGIGCVGSGFIMADCQLVSYRAAGFNPVAIASKNPAHARSVANRHRIGRVYEDYRALLVGDGLATAGTAGPERMRAAGQALRAAGIQRLDAIAEGDVRDEGTLRAITSALHAVAP